MSKYRLIITVLCAVLFFARLNAEILFSDIRQVRDTRDYSEQVVIDGNNLAMFLTNFGNFAYDRSVSRGQSNGLYFPNDWPADSSTVFYDAGLWLGARVDGQVRVTVSEYSAEYVPGHVDQWGNIVDDPDHRVYRIIRGQTEDEDYINWPVEQGAPLNAAGTGPWIEDLDGVSQMCFAVFNDLDPVAHTNYAGGSSPLGIEVRMTSWVYDEAPRDQTIFLRFQLANKGTNFLEDFIVGIWVDPDVGGAGDDLVGSIPEMNLGYAYNGDPFDAEYELPPAAGVALVHGLHEPAPGDSAWYDNSWHQGEHNLPMTAFSKYINGTDPHSPIESYNFLQGLNSDGTPVYNPANGQITTYMVSGDPVHGTGWLDTDPGDRRFMISCGPVDLAPGETQELTAVVVVGQGENHLASIVDLMDRTSLAVAGAVLPPLQYNHYHFVNVPPGSQETGLQYLVNHGSQALALDSLTFSDHRFTCEAEFPVVVDPGAEISLPVSFSADDAELREADFQVYCEGFERPFTGEISANGPWYAFMPEELDFGQVNNDPRSRLTVLSNPGTATLEVSGYSAAFALTVLPDVFTLEPGAELELEVTIIPRELGEFQENLMLQANLPSVFLITLPLSWETHSYWGQGVELHFADRPVSSVNWGGAFFFGGLDFGYNFFGSTLPMDFPYPDVALYFDLNDTTWCQTYRRDLDYPRGGVGVFPGSAWDLSDSLNPRRLNICFVEMDNFDEDGDGEIDYVADRYWELHEGFFGGRQYVFVMNSDYTPHPEMIYGNGDWNEDGVIDPDLDVDDNGSSDDPWDGEDELLWGPAADVLFAWWPRLIWGHEFAFAEDDHFVFGNIHYQDSVVPPLPIPRRLTLNGIYPNPFNPATTVEFACMRPGRVEMTVFNLLGEVVDRRGMVVDSPGRRKFTWNGADRASGMYFLRLRQGDQMVTGKMLLMK